MQLLTRILSISRNVRLGRQLKEVENIIVRLSQPAQRELARFTLREMNRAARCDFPHLYGTPADQRHSPWGTGTETGLQRARSDNPQIRLRGLALWIAVAFHETRHAEQATAQAQHRHVLRLIRQLKGTLGDDADSSVSSASAVSTAQGSSAAA